MKRDISTTLFQRLLAMLLSLIMIFSVCDTAIISLAYAIDPSELSSQHKEIPEQKQEDPQGEASEETQEDVPSETQEAVSDKTQEDTEKEAEESTEEPTEEAPEETGEEPTEETEEQPQDETETDPQNETREETKARLMRQIIEEGWDPYSSDMTVAEFFALMELFDEGLLPLNQQATYATTGVETRGPSYIPREKFLFAGLTNYKRNEGSTDSEAPQIYDTNNNYEDYTDAEGNLQYHYPAGLDPYSVGYMRPPANSWNGVRVTDTTTNRVVLVSEGVNDADMSIAGNVVQGLFASYTGYYVKQVTIDGANVNVLGMIALADRYIYYYLSAEGQNTQVSTTTLSDDAKFIVEYVPIEHQINYRVRLGEEYVTNDIPSDVVFFGSQTPTQTTWVNSIFGSSPARRTTDGAYSFDVFVPYGYDLQILISIEMSVDVPYTAHSPSKNSFDVEIDHTGTKQAVHDAWLKAYYDYLLGEHFFDSGISFETFVRDYITETKNTSTGNITLRWKNESDPDKDAHNSILLRMAERINDFTPRNDGYPLGMYPDYSKQGPGGFKILPDTSKSPTEHTMNATFYNHLVKADRTVTAVLTPQPAPTFDVSQVLQKSSGALDRGGSASENFALQSIQSYDEARDYYDADYEYHDKVAGTSYNGAGDILLHGAVYPNVQPATGSWNWDFETGTLFKGKAQNMRLDKETGTYYYSWVFQTNSGSNDYYLDVFEVNGIAIQIPYYPKYNWKNSYIERGAAETADDTHPYYTELKLADGATLRLEFLLGWNGGNGTQRHYRVTVTGARSNVVVTGLNLMQYATGSDEFATYNMTGVYSDRNGESQTAPAIEYYGKDNQDNPDSSKNWYRTAQSNVVVNCIDYANGDSDPKHYGANIRFKIADGYGSPYYSWTNRHGDAIEGQTSLTDDGTPNDVISLADVGSIQAGEPGALVNGKLSPQYIYGPDSDGYYYIRVTTQSPYKIALLNVIAHTVKFTVRYTPEYGEGEDAWSGFVIDPQSGELVALTQEWMEEHKRDVSSDWSLALDPDSMPIYKHNPDICALWEMAKDETGDVPEYLQDIMHQYDDNDGPFYDLLYNTMATIASNSYGTIRPNDKNNNYLFVNWVVVGEDFTPVTDKSGNPIQFLGGAIDFTQYAHYAVKHAAFGNADTDIYVLRLMPVWRQVINPFTYNIVLNWVDALGQIHAENFNDYWDDVVTEMTVDGKVYVYLNKDAKPLLDWIANHPTYTFWDEVNNATDTDVEVQEVIAAALTNYREVGDDAEDAVKQIIAMAVGDDPEDEPGTSPQVLGEIATAIDAYLGSDHENFDNILNALTQKSFTDLNGKVNPANDTFARLGSDIYVVNGSNGTITVWMNEDKGGTVFRKEVLPEPYGDDEFYFTVINDDGSLNGTFKAYPQEVFDEDGKPRDRTDDDAWLVEFKDGKIVSIDGDKKATYFTLKSGDGVALYALEGTYTIAELGSKSGGDYKAKVSYTAPNGSTTPEATWTIPPDDDLWLKGSEKIYHTTAPDDVQQVAATVDFEIGEHDVAQTLTFYNQTISLAIENQLIAAKSSKVWDHIFDYDVSFTLLEGYTPLYNKSDDFYYYSVNIYTKKNNKYVFKESRTLEMERGALPDKQSFVGRIISLLSTDNVWHNAESFHVLPDEYAAIVLPASPDASQSVSYKVEQAEPEDGAIWYLQGNDYDRDGTITVADTTAYQLFVNMTTDSAIYVHKTVSRRDGKTDTTRFRFTVTLQGTYTDDYGVEHNASEINGAFNDATFRNGVATFYLRDGEAKFLSPMPAGLTYTVEETPNEDYKTTSTNATGTIIEGQTSFVYFTNTRIIDDPCYLLITETGGTGDERFLYRIRNTETGEELIVSVKGGGKTLVECPQGNYTVAEISDWAWRYEAGTCAQSMPVTVTDANTETSPAHADFSNASNGKVWLGSENRQNNLYMLPAAAKKLKGPKEPKETESD